MLPSPGRTAGSPAADILKSHRLQAADIQERLSQSDTATDLRPGKQMGADCLHWLTGRRSALRGMADDLRTLAAGRAMAQAVTGPMLADQGRLMIMTGGPSAAGDAAHHRQHRILRREGLHQGAMIAGRWLELICCMTCAACVVHGLHAAVAEHRRLHSISLVETRLPL